MTEFFRKRKCPISTVPTEILINIYFMLPVNEVMKCRLVCIRWKTVIDGLLQNEHFWYKFCQKDYNNHYVVAKKKAKMNLSWYNLYKCFYLWPRLARATEENDEFASASRLIDEVRGINILQNGLLGVHKKCAIEYYDVVTLKPFPRCPITGDYARYSENESVIIIQSYHLHLFIIRKVVNTNSDSSTMFTNVKMYLLTDTELFYVKLNNEIYVCNISPHENISNKFIYRTNDLNGVMSLGYSNGCLNVLTYQRNIYCVVDNTDLVLKQSISNERNILDTLYKYNFLEQLDWRVYFQWMYVLNHTVPQGPMRDIIVIRSYGDLFLVGTTYGVFSIFYKPFTNGEIDLFNKAPLKQINFMERSDIPVLATCPILDIDVLEIENGHLIFVAMPKKVAVLKYTHNNLTSPTWAQLPYDQTLSNQLLEISNNKI